MTGDIDVIIASANQDKTREMAEILADLQIDAPRVRFRTMREAGFTGVIREAGVTFEENALIKARAVHGITGGTVLADDSGLSVDLLNGAPGIYSARFAGKNTSYPEKIRQLLEMLSAWPPTLWNACFICAMALIRPDGSETVVRGECRGRISPESLGSGGFGYDPVFLLPDLGLTLAQLSPADKHKISHRGRALREIIRVLQSDCPPGGILLSEHDVISRFAGYRKIKILVFSDSHGQTAFMQRCVKSHPDIDLILHLGDHSDDPNELAELLGKPLAAVTGNNDGWTGMGLPANMTLEIAGYRIFVTHGHRFGVKTSLRTMADFAASPEIRADTVLFGHTHRLLDQTATIRGKPLLLLNPGASRNGMVSRGSAILLEIGPDRMSRTKLLDE